MEELKTLGYTLQAWKSFSDISKIEYSAYWNNAALEVEKEVFWVSDGDFDRMERYLNDSGLIGQFHQALEFLDRNLGRCLEGTGADLAAGNLWAVPLILQSGPVKKIYAIEYSKHRLVDLGPKVLQNYRVPRDNVILCLGSFYELEIAHKSLDFIFLAQAFHHADDTDRLLGEIRRVLKPKGVVLIIGEHVFDKQPSVRGLLKAAAKRAVSRSVAWIIQGLFRRRHYEEPTFFSKLRQANLDPILGDHYYSLREYHDIFSRNGFRYWNLRGVKPEIQSFVLVQEH